ncbi:Atu4866 domain-containing protein [Streptomyces sp. DH37]|uniref:Atu4866 domain-containing protein n=1 Tax=Streptomyces sp. DH37 TaxID=3040122 RepID=UPI0024432B91|nr:Atu4866 domain-containing protein [Streptomyces sp. DH37]MDG9703495.1 Atu4866 domain-containing protein [Streptomyces sp. DH37]
MDTVAPAAGRGERSEHVATLTPGNTGGLLVVPDEPTADGRYDETRGGRPHACRGRYWIDGDRIDYPDDLGFWAVGYFRGDEPHRAGYVMRRD